MTIEDKNKDKSGRKAIYDMDDEEMEILPRSDSGSGIVFGMRKLTVQKLDEEGNPIGSPVTTYSSSHIPRSSDPPRTFILDDLLKMKKELDEKRPVLYYICNQFIPERNAAGEVVYYKIPTSVFALPSERDRIIAPLEIYVLHPNNLEKLMKRCIEVNFRLEEWDWGKTQIRPEQG